MKWLACSPYLNPTEHLWDTLGAAVYSRVTNTTILADLLQMLVKEWNTILHQCVLHEEELPGCCGSSFLPSF